MFQYYIGLFKSSLNMRNVLAMVIFIGFMLVFFVWNLSLGVMSINYYQRVEVLPENLKTKLCEVNMEDKRKNILNDSNLNMIYYVTPTYPRPEQIPELTRLSHTLMHVPRLHWVVADDQPACDSSVTDVLIRASLPFTHLSSPRPRNLSRSNFARGVSNRRAALQWLRENVGKGVLYFGDDDNTIDLQLFDEMRTTRKVSMFPVGLIGSYGVSTPVVKKGKVIGFYDSWPASRTFPVDMAGFAVNLEYLNPTANMPFVAGHEEDRFLVSTGLKLEEIEPLANNCSRVLVWHTRTSKHTKPVIQVDFDVLEKEQLPHFAALLRDVARLDMATFKEKEGIRSFITRRDHRFSEPLAGH